MMVSTLQIDQQELKGMNDDLLQFLFLILFFGFSATSIMLTYTIYKILGVKEEMNEKVGVYIFRHKVNSVTRKAKDLNSILDFFT